jgi:quinohemoprotein ethanol dehydrogenase
MGVVMGRLISVTALAASALAISLLAGANAVTSAEPLQQENFLDTTDGADWPAYGRTDDANHFSPLRQINDKNVGRLGLLWYVDLPNVGRSGAPLAVDGVVYYPTGFSEIHAVDAATGHEIWHFVPEPPVTAVVGDKMKPGWGLRGIAYWKHKIYAGTQDGRLVALDAKSGRILWSQQTTRPGDGNYVTGPATVFDGKVIIGNAGGDGSHTRGYVTTYDAKTGHQLWRFYTVPGDPAKGFEDESMALAATTWRGDVWKKGAGGSPWNSLTYDSELKRVYIGTGNGSPWNQKVRSPGGGDNLFTCSIVALDAKTGKYIWHYQTTPGDAWDFDSANDIELAHLRIDGRDRRVLLHAPKNGFFYVVDRDTGKLISAEPYTTTTWASKIDLATGRPVENPDARYPAGAAAVAPFANGGHGWQPMAFSPQTGFVYIPTTDVLGGYSDRTVDLANWSRKPGVYIDGATDWPRPSGDESVAPQNFGYLQAWDPVQKKRVWKIDQRGPENGGVTATAGNLVFAGQADGRILAIAADSGKVLWSYDAQNGVLNAPITYLAHGRQYLTVVANFTGTAGIFGPLSAQFGWDYATQRRRVLTFAIDGRGKLPSSVPPPRPPPSEDAAWVANDKRTEAGFEVYSAHCFICHGVGAIAGGSAPDLRFSSIPQSAAAFALVVHDGALESKGMPKFAELSSTEVADLRHYIQGRSRQTLQRGD